MFVALLLSHDFQLIIVGLLQQLGVDALPVGLLVVDPGQGEIHHVHSRFSDGWARRERLARIEVLHLHERVLLDFFPIGFQSDQRLAEHVVAVLDVFRHRFFRQSMALKYVLNVIAASLPIFGGVAEHVVWIRHVPRVDGPAVSRRLALGEVELLFQRAPVDASWAVRVLGYRWETQVLSWRLSDD